MKWANKFEPSVQSGRRRAKKEAQSKEDGAYVRRYLSELKPAAPTGCRTGLPQERREDERTPRSKA